MKIQDIYPNFVVPEFKHLQFFQIIKVFNFLNTIRYKKQFF